jgi:DNA-binding MarR family transcriptional regulator
MLFENGDACPGLAFPATFRYAMRSIRARRRRYSDEEFARELEKVANFYAAARLKAVARTGILEDRMRVLLQVVKHDEGVTFNELLKHFNLQKYQLTRIARWLDKNRLAKLSVNPEDKRRRRLKALDVGCEKAGAFVKAIASEIINTLPGRYVQRGRAKRGFKHLIMLNEELFQSSLFDDVPGFDR